MSTFWDQIDAVVMLTWSDWKTEMRSNRYHYATRLAAKRPVYFVQPDLHQNEWRLEETEVPNVTILHVYQGYGPAQSDRIIEALSAKKVRFPMLWIYNSLMIDFVERMRAPLKVYHGTEDYFCADFFVNDIVCAQLRRVLKHCDLLVAVSEGVRESYLNNGKFQGETLVLTNGVDFDYWSEEVPAETEPTAEQRPVAIYQGGISRKIDFAMLEKVARDLSDWDFWFCGQIFDSMDRPERLFAMPNVKYFGVLHVDEVRKLAARATVGLIPFVQNDWIVRRSFPLKTFEYLAAGLPVVSVPIDAIRDLSREIAYIQTWKEMKVELVRLAPQRHNAEAIRRRRAEARIQDYGAKFARLCEVLEVLPGKIRSARAVAAKLAPRRSRVLVFADGPSLKVQAIVEHLKSFEEFSRHEVSYAWATGGNVCQVDFGVYDAVIIHYSVRLSVPGHLAPEFDFGLTHYRGLKILFIQDEYDNVESTRSYMERIAFDVVFTCVPPEYCDAVYPKARFPKTRFIHNLTGYVPDSLVERYRHASDPTTRETMIAYRGRDLPYWYGDLGQEKQMIGVRVRELAEQAGLKCDIEWASDKRIYGEDWYDFMVSARATLGTESGANVFDFDGRLPEKIQQFVTDNPGTTYDAVKKRFFLDQEGKIVMNQVSPKIFEAVAARTLLILFEGTYSGVVEPWTHFLPLKKDFSNFPEVLRLMRDDALVREMTDRAYQDVIVSGRYSYRSFIAMVDDVITDLVSRPRHLMKINVPLYFDPVTGVVSTACGALDFKELRGLYGFWPEQWPTEEVLGLVLIREDLRWRSQTIRGGLQPAFYPPSEPIQEALFVPHPVPGVDWVRHRAGLALTVIVRRISKLTGKEEDEIRARLLAPVRRLLRMRVPEAEA